MSARFARRAATATVSLSLVATAAAFAPPAQAAPTLKERFEARGATAATWQASQLTGGRIYNPEFAFNDWGLTIDTAFALAAADRRKPLGKITRALKRNWESYVTYEDSSFGGNWGKLLLATKVLKQKPRHFGGVNVRANTLKHITPASGGFERGRVLETGTYAVETNSLKQSYVVLGLARSGGAPQDVVNYLRKQQCSRGFFREEMVSGERCNTGTPSIDATALAVHALKSAKQHGAKVPANSIKRASRWLARHQRASGAFGAGPFGPNTNTTGLAGSALWITGRHVAANEASAWLSRMQLTKARAAKKRDIGAIAYNLDARKAASQDGITDATRDQFRRGTPQAMLSLYRVSLATLTK